MSPLNEKKTLVYLGTSANDKIFGLSFIYTSLSGKLSIFSNSIYGGYGDDLIRAGNGANNIVGGHGDDVIYSGIGNSQYYYFNDDGSDEIYDVGGHDQINIKGNFPSVTCSVEKTGKRSILIVKSDNIKIITLDLTYHIQGVGSVSVYVNDSLIGNYCNDTEGVFNKLIHSDTHCPTMVDYYKSDGSLIAELGNKEETIRTDDGLFCSYPDGNGYFVKEATYFDDGGKQVIKGTADGEMNYDIVMTDSNGSSETYSSEDVAITNKTVITMNTESQEKSMTIDPGDGTDAKQLSLVPLYEMKGTVISWPAEEKEKIRLYSSEKSDEEIRTDIIKDFSTEALKLFPEISDESQMTSGEVSKNYQFSGIAPGKYKIAFFKPGKNLVQIISAEVSGASLDLGDVKLQKYGDVNNDGTVDSGDGIVIYRHYAGQQSILDRADDNLNRVADVNGDGQIDGGDGLSIYRYYAEQSSALDAIK